MVSLASPDSKNWQCTHIDVSRLEMAVRLQGRVWRVCSHRDAAKLRWALEEGFECVWGNAEDLWMLGESYHESESFMGEVASMSQGQVWDAVTASFAQKGLVRGRCQPTSYFLALLPSFPSYPPYISVAYCWPITSHSLPHVAFDWQSFVASFLCRPVNFPHFVSKLDPILAPLRPRFPQSHF